MRKFKRLTLTLALLLMAVGGAWAEETPLLTIESKDNTSFTSGSKTFDDKVTVTFSNPVYYDGEEGWWYAGGDPSLLTVAGINGYTITSCKFYTGYGYAQTGYPVEGESPSVYLYGGYVFNDASQSVTLGYEGVTKIEVYGSKSEPTEWSLTPDETGKTWTLAKMPASNIELQVEYEPTKVTMAANDNAMGTVEVASGSKVEWTPDTWAGWTANTKEYTVGDITITSTNSAYINESTEAGDYLHSLSFFVNQWKDNSTVTFSTTGDPFSRIEFTMIEDYSDDWNPSIKPVDNWTFEGKSAVWEGEATKSLTLQSCSTFVSKITFYQGAAIPDGVTVNGDGTFTVAKTATVTLKATPAEGYKFLYWEDEPTNTNPVREVTIESGMADKTYKAVFAEILYNVSFVEGTNLDEWTATPATEVKKDTKVNIEYTGAKKVIGVKAEKKGAPAEEPMTLGTPLTIEAITDGTIVVNIEGTLSTGMKYSVNGGTKTTITSTTNIEGLKAGDKVQFYGNGTSTQVYGNSPNVKILGSGDGFQTKAYGNTMSLLDEEGFATKTDLPDATFVFSGLFSENTTLTDASELLLPATTLTVGCYYGMFEGCTSLTTAPKLPATTMATGCYRGMFSGCTSLTTAPKLPATTLAKSCYYTMFFNCTSLTSAYVKAAYTEENGECDYMFDLSKAAGAVLHTTPDNKASWETMMNKDWKNWTVADDWQD